MEPDHLPVSKPNTTKSHAADWVREKNKSKQFPVNIKRVHVVNDDELFWITWSALREAQRRILKFMTPKKPDLLTPILALIGLLPSLAVEKDVEFLFVKMSPENWKGSIGTIILAYALYFMRNCYLYYYTKDVIPADNDAVINGLFEDLISHGEIHKAKPKKEPKKRPEENN